MVGDMDNTGSLNAQIIHQLTTAVRSKIAIQVCWLVDLNTLPVLYYQSFTFDTFISDSAAQVCELAVWLGVPRQRFHHRCDAGKSRRRGRIWYCFSSFDDIICGRVDHMDANYSTSA